MLIIPILFLKDHHYGSSKCKLQVAPPVLWGPDNTTAVILFNFSAFFISKILLGFGITIPLYKILAYTSAKNILAKNVF